jgi:hypothetical protein
MKSGFWAIVVGVLTSAYVLAALIASTGRSRMQLDAPEFPVHVARHLLAVVWLGVVWAIIFRAEVERGRLSLFSLFVLVTIQAFGFWLVQVTLGLG